MALGEILFVFVSQLFRLGSTPSYLLNMSLKIYMLIAITHQTSICLACPLALMAAIYCGVVFFLTALVL